MKTYLVSGCGVSAVCSTKEGVMYWVAEMVKRGGIPTVMPLAEEAV